MHNFDTAEIQAYADGPLIVRGNFELRDENGELIDPGRATIALCRCGKSARKPLCDGTHSLIKKRR
ncbi:CDGSH iron-sulfur domain-containing protein [Kribbella sp. NBC_00382]|uniref:CDGSH iron-sulfur domain-containing protein n=1 Tax=Kribbella sp. NBC_00382 TaxID=2975967 RepID=UPI002E213434